MFVSTAPAFLNALKLEDVVYGVSYSVDDALNSESGTSVWNIPGLGVIGVGSAAAAIVALYVSRPEMKEELGVVTDLMDVAAEKSDESLEKTAELIGTRGGQTSEDMAPPDGKPRVAAVPVPATVAKPAEQVPDVPATVSRGPQVAAMAMPPMLAAGAPVGSLARPDANIEAIIRNTAKSEKIDYGTLYSVLGAESSFKAGASAKNSSATGLAQFTAPTWQYLIKDVYPELGYTAADRTDPQKSAIMASRYLKSIQSSLTKKLGRAPSLGETYLGYFMGPTGASRFIDQLQANPNALGADVFPNAAAANPNLFYHKGDKTKPLKLSDTMGRLDGKVTAYYAQTQQTVPQAEPAPPVQQATQIAAVKATLPPVVEPQVMKVTAPDFEALKGGSKGEARDVSTPIRAKPGTVPGEVRVAVVGTPPAAGELTYVRDKHGRLISFRS